MKTKLLKTASLFVVAIAIVIGSVAGTLAYLRATASVTNTFAYGKVAITMDETKIDVDGKTALTGTRGNGNQYLLMPGQSYVKDPIIHIGQDSQDMFIFLKVDNGIAGLALTEKEKEELGKNTIHDQLLANGWKVYNDGTTDYKTESKKKTSDGFELLSTSTVYYLSKGADANAVEPKVVGYDKTIAANNDIKTFSTFTVSPTRVNESSMTAYVNNDCKIVVTAFAVQSTGVGIAGDIHNAANIFKGEFASAIPAVPENPGNTGNNGETGETEGTGNQEPNGNG